MTAKREFQPRPELVTEAREMLDLHFQGDDVVRIGIIAHVVVTVPIDLATFGAWLGLRDRMAMRGDCSPLTRPLDVIRDDGSEGEDWPRFEDFARWAVTSKIMEAKAELEAGTHPLLDPSPTVGPGGEIDGDIPF